MNAGLQLRHAREQRRLTLREVSNVTKVPIAALEAIEQGEITRLPGGIFTRGFVRAYAAAVGLDPHDTVDEFLAQFYDDSGAESTPEEESAEANTTANRIPMFGSLALGGILLVYSAYVASTGTSAKSSPAALLPATPIGVSGLESLQLPAVTPSMAIVSASMQVSTAPRPRPAETSTASAVGAPALAPLVEDARDVPEAPAATTGEDAAALARRSAEGAEAGLPVPDTPPAEPAANAPDPGR